jgi:hypothetical protein
MPALCQKYWVENDLLIPIRDLSKRIIATGHPPVDALHATMKLFRMPASMLIHYAGGRHTAVVAMLSADRSPPSPPELLELTCVRHLGIII